MAQVAWDALKGLASASNRISSLILFGAVAAAPLPFGSMAPSVVAGWCGVLGAALIMSSPRALRSPQFTVLVAIAVVVAAYAVVLHEQLAAVPWIAEPHPIWAEAAKLLKTELAPSASIAKNEPLFALGAPLAAILAFSSSYIVCADRHRAHELLQVVAWSGVVYAVFGIGQHLLDPTGLLWGEKTDYLASVTGTFVNRNTAAVYFGSCAVVCLLLLLKEFRSDGGHRSRSLTDIRAVLAWDRGLSRPQVIAIARGVILIAALLMTKSRAGVVFSLLGLVVAFALYRKSESNGRRNIWLLFALGGLGALALLQWLGGSVGSRFDESGLSDAARIETYRSTLNLIRDFPWFGTGLGTFVVSFPAFRGDGAIWGRWNRAHDTLLEIASEGGLPLMVLTVAVWGLLVTKLIYGIRTRWRDIIIPIAALSVAIIGIAHSLVDFSLQITGYAIPVFALLGAGIAQSYPTHTKLDDLR